MAVLGVSPGRVVGDAQHFLTELRIARGPMPRDAVIAELRRWYAARGSVDA